MIDLTVTNDVKSQADMIEGKIPPISTPIIGSEDWVSIREMIRILEEDSLRKYPIFDSADTKAIKTKLRNILGWM